MRSRAMKTLLHLLTGPRSQLSPVPSKALPPGTCIRPYRPADKDACIEIYNQNELGRFPAGVRGQFEKFLEDLGYLKLICCIDDEPVAIVGVGRIPALLSHHVWLVFGMVRPALHRRGIGTAMLLARIAALPRPVKPIRVILSSVAASDGFFTRFGFTYQGQMAVPPSGMLLDVKSAILNADSWEACRSLLQGMGIDAVSFPPVPSMSMWSVQSRSPHAQDAV